MLTKVNVLQRFCEKAQSVLKTVEKRKMAYLKKMAGGLP